jgi:hypothetical protein
VLGAEAVLTDSNPVAFDCSEESIAFLIMRHRVSSPISPTSPFGPYKNMFDRTTSRRWQSTEFVDPSPGDG